ncbi:hypothetical protein BCh11DRAFT_01444 [Burkholderia sp. Ch1-1]|uniref:DUF2474 domain-containing protein n=1 Tax=Paraburkholderia dioscoreae TaxID=2604047 RepID=A0A5Q4ZL18_9BURK|nr:MULTISPECIES: hypothetical protein [Paraburkholderia]EIF33668.1 hypothetical protein BCh11DRAFT_01444 [Burkholderia sp. Ch1-1]MDR8399666.1 hypothetical protein [Paraburkholderia sp. USG1]VVD32537.1 conserved protein of unknown function [Paraburkholderia dioscoreae]
MATNITITKQAGSGATRSGTHGASPAPSRKLPGWLWFIALWCFGVGSAMSLGFAFKILMNATLFAIK